MKIGCIERSAERRLELMQCLDSAFAACRGFVPPAEILPFDPATEDEINVERTPEICVVGPGYSLDQAFWISCTLKKNYFKSQICSSADSLSSSPQRVKELLVFIVVSPENNDQRSIQHANRFATALLCEDDPPTSVVKKIVDSAFGTYKSRRQLPSSVLAPLRSENVDPKPPIDLCPALRPVDRHPALRKQIPGISNCGSAALTKPLKLAKPLKLTKPLNSTPLNPTPAEYRNKPRILTAGELRPKRAQPVGPIKILPGVWIRGNEIENHSRWSNSFGYGFAQSLRKIIEFLELPTVPAAVSDHRRSDSESANSRISDQNGWSRIRGNRDAGWGFNRKSGHKLPELYSSKNLNSGVWLKFSH